MKKVLKHGKMYYFKVCERCNCEFIYQEGDISYMRTKDDNTYANKVTCPDCTFLNFADKQRYNYKAII